jgi:hypothetical protein
LSAAFQGRLPSALLPGHPAQITISVKNSGADLAKGKFGVQLYASSDPALDASDVMIGSVARKATLKPSRGSAAFKLKFKPPAALSEGGYYLLARVASSDGQLSTTTIAPAPVPVVAPFVRLTATITQFPLQAAGSTSDVGGNLAVIKIKNLGNVTAKGKLAITWLLSSDTHLDKNDIVVSAPTRQSVHISPGKSILIRAQLSIPNSTPVGTFHLLAIANATGGIAESQFENNVAVSTPVQVLGPAPVTERGGSEGQSHDHPHDHLAGIGYGAGLVVYDEGGYYVDDVPPDGSYATAPPDGSESVYPGPDPSTGDQSSPDTVPTPTPAPDTNPAPDPQPGDTTSDNPDPSPVPSDPGNSEGPGGSTSDTGGASGDSGGGTDDSSF